MFKTINVYDFRDEFKAMGRANQFSYDGLQALFEMLEEIAPEYELDVIALCCDYTESTIEDIANNYCISEQSVLAHLSENTFFIELNNGSVLYQQF
jgi:hypothetical protein